MTTVHCWDEYSYEEQQKIIEDNKLMKIVMNLLLDQIKNGLIPELENYQL